MCLTSRCALLKVVDLKQLTKQIPYRWRIQSFSKDGNKASVVAYIDARDVMNLLDDVLGPENWQDKYHAEGDLLISGIGIKVGEEWVWKHDTGTKTTFEEEKGQLSDAFKRAAVKWGIGRFLYDMDVRWIRVDKNKRPVDESGQPIWNLTEYMQRINSG